jgi:hypothetical protein
MVFANDGVAYEREKGVKRTVLARARERASLSMVSATALARAREHASLSMVSATALRMRKI